MLQRIITLIVCAFVSSYASAENSLTGHWIGLDKQSVAEFTDNEVIITLLSERYNNTKISTNFEKINATRYRLSDDKNRVSALLVMDWTEKVFSIQNLLGNFSILNFKPAPQITTKDLLGTWYSHDNIGSYETSTIITQKGSSYDFDLLEIDHDEKSYIRTFDKDVKFSLKNGFAFVEINPEDEEEYTYYLISYTKDMLTYADAYGDSWSESRKDGAVHLEIPDGYTERKYE